MCVQTHKLTDNIIWRLSLVLIYLLPSLLIKYQLHFHLLYMFFLINEHITALDLNKIPIRKNKKQKIIIDIKFTNTENFKIRKPMYYK